MPANSARNSRARFSATHDATRLQPAGAVEARAGDDHVEEQRILGRGVGYEGEEARRVDRDHGRCQVVLEELEDLVGVVTLGTDEALHVARSRRVQTADSPGAPGPSRGGLDSSQIPRPPTRRRTQTSGAPLHGLSKLIPCLSYDLKRPSPTGDGGTLAAVELASRDGNAAYWLSRARRLVLARSRLHHGERDAGRVRIASSTCSRSVADSSLDQGLVPLENAIEGTVSATIDGLVFDHELVIVREIVIPIRLHLLARPGVASRT